MKNSKDVKKYKESIKTQPVILALIFVFIGFTFIAMPQASATFINVSREISAPVGPVWGIISDANNEIKYWSTYKQITNINRTDNTVERMVTISTGPQNTSSHQLVTLYPEQMKVQTTLMEGLVTGSRLIEVEPISNSKSRVDVLWDIDLSGIPIVGRGFAENGIKQTTEEALLKIAETVEK